MSENAIVSINSIMGEATGTVLCSIKTEPGDKEKARIVYNAMNTPTHNLRDFVNKHIVVENVLIEVSEILDEETGVLDRVPRTVLITPEGESYAATSKGIFTSIRNAFQAFGPAPWDGGIEFEVKQRPVGRGTMLTLAMV